MNMLNNSVHKSILVQILKDIYSDGEIAPYLGFKGGTAVYLFYELDRFSVDLDFDLLREDKQDLVFTHIENIIKKYGNIKDARQKRYSLFFLLSYESIAHNIKVEINLRKFDSRYELKNYLGISMLVMKPEDMFAHKLVAMKERLGKANRDIYDVHFLLKKQWSINESIIDLRTELSLNDFIDQCIQGLQKLSNRNILSGIGELLNSEQKAQVKMHLLDDTIFLLGSIKR